MRDPSDRDPNAELPEGHPDTVKTNAGAASEASAIVATPMTTPTKFTAFDLSGKRHDFDDEAERNAAMAYGWQMGQNLTDGQYAALLAEDASPVGYGLVTGATFSGDLNTVQRDVYVDFGQDSEVPPAPVLDPNQIELLGRVAESLTTDPVAYYTAVDADGQRHVFSDPEHRDDYVMMTAGTHIGPDMTEAEHEATLDRGDDQPNPATPAPEQG